jgi:hypothetical protein
MPALNFIKILGNLKFFAVGLKLPINFDEKYYKDRNPEKGEQGNMPQTNPPWFMAPHPGYKYQQDSCDKIGKNFKDFHDTMIDAVGFAHNMWKLQAKFGNLQIMAVSAIGSPGCLSGPELESLIKTAPQCAAWTGNMAKHRDAVAKGVSKCFKNWQDQVTIPGLPLYPAFAAFPGPMAPPMPNIPVPLIACISGQMSMIITPSQMQSEMGNALDGGLKDKDKTKQYDALYGSIALVLSLSFMIWLASQQLMLTLGKGPIPTFAPPFVPVGPVVAGDNISIPGHVMT